MSKSHFGVSSVAGEMAHFPVVGQFPVRYVIYRFSPTPIGTNQGFVRSRSADDV